MTKISVVLGPPGTGKTTTLLEMVERELAAGVSPDKIGLVTFTRRGATEAVERATKKFSLSKGQLPWFSTLHSLCYRRLNVRSSDMLVGKVFFEFADYAGIEVTGRAWSDDGTLSSFKYGDRILFMENLSRIRRVPLREQYEIDSDGLSWNEVSRVATRLADFKQKRGLLDYTDLLSEFVAHGSDLGLQRLFVDEAQDLSRLQWDVVQLLGRSCDRVVVAGDDDQAIYRWAGADVDTLIGMEGEVRVLGQSYRVPPAVQAVSHSIIDGVRHRRPKEWAAKVGRRGVVLRDTSFGSVKLRREGSILVLARNNYVIREQIEPDLRSRGIVYELNGKSSVPADVVTAAAAWEDLKRNREVSLGSVRVMYKFISAHKGVRRGHKTLKSFGEDDEVNVTMKDLIASGGLLTDPSLIWHEALDKMPEGDMTYMLTALRHGEKLRSGRPRVRLSTIHSAKGGEADQVVLMREMAKLTYNEMHANPDDERRCWYVGVTRAREQLNIVSGETNRECPWL